MDNEVKNCVKSFITANVRRVQIALALAVIKSKPEGITAAQHAANIQARCRIKYSNCMPERSGDSNQPVSYDMKMLSLQQEQLISSLWRALPQQTINDPMDSQLQNSHLYQGCSNDMFEDEDSMTQTDVQMGSNSDDLLTEQNELNLLFIQAMVQLKSVVNTCSYVPAPELRNMLLAASTGNSKETEEHQTEPSIGQVFSDRSRSQQLTVIPDFQHSEMGFGFGTNSSAGVSSGILKYIIHSSDANHLLVRSVEAVLQYLGQSILTANSESLDLIVQNWKGSVLEYSVNVLVELVDHFAYQAEGQNECREICFTFFCNVVNGILNKDSLNMHPIWTQQCCVIVELGNCKPLCTDFLNFLIEKIQIMFINLKPKPASASNAESKYSLDHKPGDIEKSFYIFYMTEKLLKKWKKFHSSETSTNKSDSSQGSGTNILHLWRRNWSKSGSNSKSSERHDNTECNPALRWKDVLEKLVMNTTEDYPFITLYSFKCFKLLQSGS